MSIDIKSSLIAFLHLAKSYVKKVLVIVIFVCIGLIGLIVFFEGKFIYFPEKMPKDVTYSTAPKESKEIWFTTADGVKINGLYAKAPDAKFTLLWFHGNAGNMENRFDMLKKLLKVGIDILIIDYRSYGKSEGSPSEEGLYKDADGAYDFLISEMKIPPERIIIFGKSLGSAVAIDLASRVKCAGLIVQSSFTSAKDMAKYVMPFFPARYFMRTNFDSISKISKITVPKLFIHSPADEVIPFEQGKKLFEAAPEPKRFYEVPYAAHNYTYIIGGEKYLDEFRKFVKSLSKTN